MLKSLTETALERHAVVSSFSAPRPFIEAVRELARSEGRTISELIREALTEKHDTLTKSAGDASALTL